MIENKDNEAKQLKALDRKSHLCDVCGIQFFGGGKAKYCSNACKQKSKYQRTKEGSLPRPGAKIQKIKMTTEDKVAIGSLLELINALREHQFSYDLIINNHSFLFDQYVETLSVMKSALQQE